MDIGKRNNQTFTQIPYRELIEMVAYKAEEEGIEVIQESEDYTSKCSFLDGETIEHHEEYVGKRKKSL